MVTEFLGTDLLVRPCHILASEVAWALLAQPAVPGSGAPALGPAAASVWARSRSPTGPGWVRYTMLEPWHQPDTALVA